MTHEIGELRFETGGDRWRVKCDGIAWHDGTVEILSVAGQNTAIKAVRACLADKCVLRIQGDLPVEKPYSLFRYGAGYEFHLTKLPYQTWHMVAIAKDEGLLTSIEDESLWRHLTSDRYTTPVLKPWLPWLRETLIEKEWLTPLAGFQISAGKITCTIEDLDAAVSEGLTSGRITI